MAKIYNSKILDFSSTPLKKPEGQFWYDSSNKVLKRSDGESFLPINIENNYIDNNATTLSKKLESIDTNLSNVVHKTGDEQIAGNKTFSDSISLSTTNDFSTSCTILSDSITIQSGDDSSQNSTSIGSNGISVNDVTNITGFGFSTMPLVAGEEIVLLSSGASDTDFNVLLPNRKPIFIGSKVETIAVDGNIDSSTGEGYNLHFGVGYEYDAASITVSETPVIKGSLVDSSVSSSSLDTHIPTSKAVYDAISSKQDSLKYYSETDSGYANINAEHHVSLSGVEGFSLGDSYENQIYSSGSGGVYIRPSLAEVGKYINIVSDSENKDISVSGIDNLSVNASLKLNNEDVLTTSDLTGYIKENTDALVSGIHNNSSSPLQIYASDPSSYGDGNNINIIGGYYGIVTLAGDGDQASDHPRIIVDPALGIKLLNHNIILDNTKDITGEVSTNTEVSISTNELVLNAPKVSGTLVATDVSESHTEKPNMLITAQAVYWALDTQRVNLTNAINDAKLTAGTGINISEDNVISVEYPEFVASITDEYTASTSLNSFLTNNNYGVTSGKIIITPNINNVGPIYFGEGLTSAAKGFPVYPDQIITLSFNNLENFKCYAASAGDKFNYIAYIGEVDNSGAGTASGNINANEVKLTSPNGIQYSISITDEGIIQVDPA